MNNNNTNKNESALEERLQKLQKIKQKKQKKFQEISSKIESAQKKETKYEAVVYEKISNRKRIENDIKSINKEISSIRKELLKRLNNCLEVGHQFKNIEIREISYGTVTTKKCVICGTVESEFLRNISIDYPILNYKHRIGRAE